MKTTRVHRPSAGRAGFSRSRRATLTRLAAIAALLPLFQGTCVDIAQRVAATALVDSIGQQIEQSGADAIARIFGTDGENP